MTGKNNKHIDEVLYFRTMLSLYKLIPIALVIFTEHQVDSYQVRKPVEWVIK